MERVELKLDEASDLTFKVMIEGTKESASEIRLICIGDDVSYVFKGAMTEEVNEVRVAVPSMKDKIKEGLYETKLEVIIEGRCISPLQFLTNFKEGVKVVAESVKIAEKPHSSGPQVTASVVGKPIVVTKRVAVVEERPKETVTKEVQTEAVRPAAVVTEEVSQPVTLRQLYSTKKSKK